MSVSDILSQVGYAYNYRHKKGQTMAITEPKPISELQAGDQIQEIRGDSLITHLIEDVELDDRHLPKRFKLKKTAAPFSAHGLLSPSDGWRDVGDLFNMKRTIEGWLA